MKIYNLVIVGAGGRGRGMASLAIKSKRAKIAAVAETNTERRNLFQKEFGLPKNNCYQDYRTFLKSDLKIDGVFVTTTPNHHSAITCACLEKSIPVFLEKPMAINLKDAAKIVKVAKETGTRLQVGFNCRYAPFFVKMKEIVSSGGLGEILSLEWKEVLGPHHWSTYCRYPSYNKKDVIGSWLLEKCCHDLDLMNWLVESPCHRVASFGSRSYFNPRDNLPKYCTDNCPIENECIFSAFKFHPELKENSEKLPKFYTLCVYNSGSDLIDHQSAILEYSNGVTATFSLIPLIQEERSSRFVYICGTKASLKGDWSKNRIRLFPHEGKEEIVCDPDLSEEREHGGGDPKIVSAFLDWLDDPGKLPKTTEKEGWEAMLVGCGIDLALREHKVVDLDIYRNLNSPVWVQTHR